MSEAVLLGSGGWMPTSARETCCALLRRGEHAVVIDAGTGMRHMVERPELLAGATSVDIVLTHFHLDHVVGLAYLPALSPATLSRIHAPGRWLYGPTSADILARLIGPPFFALPLAEMVADVVEIDEHGASIGSFQMSARAQRRHDAPTAALRFDDVLAYCTDTAYDEENAIFARGCRTLAHEAWRTEGSGAAEATHSSARDAARVAADAGVERLVLTHIRPGCDVDALVAEASGVFPETVPGVDLLTIPA